MATYENSGPKDFDGLVEPLSARTQEVALRLRALIRAALPEASETVSGGARLGMVLYSIDGPNDVVCGIQPTDALCKLFFHGWKPLKDAGYRLEGSGRHARHIKIRSMDEIQPEEITQMIRIALEAR